MITNLKQAFDNRILYATSSSTEIHNCSYASLIHTYLLSGEFKFYGGAKYLFCNDEQVVINMYRENENLSLVDNIHDKNWDSEEKLIYEKYINCKRYESLDGTNLCLIGTQWANSNIFHLLFDSIGKISILSKFYDPKDLVFLIPEGVGIFQKLITTFDLKYQTYNMDCIYSGNILVPSMPSHFGNSSFDVYQTLQKLSRDIDCGDGKDYRYIYISRRKADKRSMLNEGDLLCLLRNKLPFIELFLEDLSFKDQISIIKNASFIVAPHGAGLAWSIFQTEGILLEIFPPNYVNHCYASLPRNFGVKYISYYCDPEKTTNYYHPELSNSSFKIDLVHFEIFFESLKGELNS